MTESIPPKVSKKVRILQAQFLNQCVDSSQTLDETLDDLGIPPETLSGWLIERDFRVRLHGMRRFLRKARDLQLEIGALRAAQMLTRVATDTAKHDAKPIARSACVDLIRLARDSRARASASNPSVDDLTKRSALYHPDVSEDEARELIEELARRDATAGERPAAALS